MLRATADNTPVQEIKGRWIVVRVRPAPPPKPPTLESNPFALVGTIFGGIVRVLLWPSWTVWKRTATRPQPPGALEFAIPTLALNVIGSVLTVWGGIEIAIGQIVPRVTPTPPLLIQWEVVWRWMRANNHPDQQGLIVCILPAVLLACAYPLWLWRVDSAAIGAVATTRKKMHAAQRMAIQAGEVVAVGQVRGRTWEPESQSWDIAPAHSDIAKAEIVTFDADALARHVLTVAPTRGGKTANIIRPLIGFCTATRSAGIFFDPKGDDLDPTQFTRNFSLQPGEADTSFRLCLIDPALSPQKAVAKLAEGLIPATSPAYFSNAAREAFEAIMLLYYAVYRVFPELTDVLIYTKSAAAREELVKAVTENRTTGSAHGQATDAARRQYQVEQDALLKYYGMEESAASKNDPLAGVRHAISPLAEGQYVDYVTTKPDYGVTIPELLAERQLTRFAFSVEEGEAGRLLGRIVIRLYTDYVLSPRADDSYLKLIVIDEAHNYICPALTEGIPQSAGRRAGYVLAVQSLAQIRAVGGDAAAQIIFGNSKNRIVMAGVEHGDAQTFSADMGRASLPTVSTSTGESISQGRGNSTSVGGAGQSRSAGTGTSTNRSQGYVLRERWLPGEISMIPRFHAIVRREGGDGEPETTLVRFLTPDEKATLIPPAPMIVPPPLDRRKRAGMPLTEANPSAIHPALLMAQAAGDAAERKAAHRPASDASVHVTGNATRLNTAQEQPAPILASETTVGE